MKYLFVDESGDHNLLPDKIDPQFPMFVLTGIVFDSREYRKFKAKLLRLKKKLFNNEKIILHSKELTHPVRTKQKELGSLTNLEARKNLYQSLDKLIDTSSLHIFIYVVDKKEFNNTLGSLPIDLYFLSYANIFRKFETLLKFREHGKVFAETRSKSLDRQFILTWKNSKITKRYKALEPQILLKSWRHAGLELADLISYRISRNIVKKPVKPIGNELNLKLIMKKNPKIEKFALKKEKHIRTSP